MGLEGTGTWTYKHKLPSTLPASTGCSLEHLTNSILQSTHPSTEAACLIGTDRYLCSITKPAAQLCLEVTELSRQHYMQCSTINTYTTFLCILAGQFELPRTQSGPPSCQHHTWMHSSRHFCLFQSDKRISLFSRANNKNSLKAH